MTNRKIEYWVIPPEAEPLAAIGRRVKAAFDPRGILNPGRMRAGE